MVPDRIEREILIDAPIEVVWAVVTEPEHVGKWLGNSAAIELRPGGEMLMTWGEGGRVSGRIERVEPPHIVAFRWGHLSRGPGSGAELRAENSTLVEFRLTAEGEGTRLRVVESGFARFDGTPEENARDAEDHERGWEHELGDLVDYIATLRGATRR